VECSCISLAFSLGPLSFCLTFHFSLAPFSATSFGPVHFALFSALCRIRNLLLSTRVGDISPGVHSHKYLQIVTHLKLVWFASGSGEYGDIEMEWTNQFSLCQLSEALEFIIVLMCFNRDILDFCKCQVNLIPSAYLFSLSNWIRKV